MKFLIIVGTLLLSFVQASSNEERPQLPVLEIKPLVETVCTHRNGDCASYDLEMAMRNHCKADIQTHCPVENGNNELNITVFYCLLSAKDGYRKWAVLLEPSCNEAVEALRDFFSQH